MPITEDEACCRHGVPLHQDCFKCDSDPGRPRAERQVVKAMDDKTREALELSIRKWEDIVAGHGTDRKSANCALCTMFLPTGPCTGCPVNVATGLPGCHGTPYMQWLRAQNNQRTPAMRATTPELKTLAQAELDFLKSLRPST